MSRLGCTHVWRYPLAEGGERGNSREVGLQGRDRNVALLDGLDIGGDRHQGIPQVGGVGQMGVFVDVFDGFSCQPVVGFAPGVGAFGELFVVAADALAGDFCALEIR